MKVQLVDDTGEVLFQTNATNAPASVAELRDLVAGELTDLAQRHGSLKETLARIPVAPSAQPVSADT